MSQLTSSGICHLKEFHVCLFLDFVLLFLLFAVVFREDTWLKQPIITEESLL